MPTQTTIGKTTLRLVVGDIAEQDTDAVVTAAHWRLNKGMGTELQMEGPNEMAAAGARFRFRLAIDSPLSRHV